MKLAWAAAAALVACGGAKVEAGGAARASSGSAPAASSAPSAPVAPTPLPPADVELRGASTAVLAGGASLGFDGEPEALAWPALRKAVPSKPRAPLVVAVPRDVPVHAVLRAAWTLRDADLQVRTADASGAPHVLALHPKPEGAPATGCHLAVFLTADGSLRVAAPGGTRTITGDAPAETLARALADERTRCPIRYVAFGTEKAADTWASVFDLATTATRDGAAGDARIVLATPVHPPAPASSAPTAPLTR